MVFFVLKVRVFNINEAWDGIGWLPCVVRKLCFLRCRRALGISGRTLMKVMKHIGSQRLMQARESDSQILLGHFALFEGYCFAQISGGVSSDISTIGSYRIFGLMRTFPK